VCGRVLLVSVNYFIIVNIVLWSPRALTRQVAVTFISPEPLLLCSYFEKVFLENICGVPAVGFEPAFVVI
jgi:hypothetical protein